MAFNLDTSIHPDVAPLAWLVGRWEGAGIVGYPTIESAQFGQEVVCTHDGRPFLEWQSRAWLLDDEGNKVRDAAQETGFLRARPEGRLELVLAVNTGFSEIWYGQAEGGKIELRTAGIGFTESAKEVTEGHRLYGNVEGDLLYAYDMAAVGQPLQPHLWARLQRV